MKKRLPTTLRDYSLRIAAHLAFLSCIAAPQLVSGQEYEAIAGATVFSHKLVADQKCSACHLDSTAGINFDFTFLPDSPHKTSIGYFHVSQTKVGSYQVAQLNDPLLRTHLKLKDEPALIVVDTHEPAGEASLEFGDVILAIEDQPVTNLGDLKTKIAKAEKGTFKIKGIRSGEKTTLEVRVEDLSPAKPPFRIGLHIETPSATLRSQLNLFDEEGIVVTEVVEESPAEKAGIKVHDILLRAAGNRLSSQEDLRDSVQQSDGEKIELILMRGGKEESTIVKPQRAPAEAVASVCPAMNSSQQYYTFDPTGAVSTELKHYFTPKPDESISK